MNKEYVFCEECRDDVSYYVKNVQMTGTVKGKEYHYYGKEAHCQKCDSLVFVPELQDHNLSALYSVYREENNIISLDLIREIPEKYDIGKRPLSLLLGWGEQTFSRYCDGDIPSRQYSDILTKIYYDPRAYSELLESNKDNLKSDNSYEKSRRAVDMLLSPSRFESSKINKVIQYLLNRCEDITPLALQKALYYIQGFYFAFNKMFLFSEDCQAWAHGPVYVNVYYKYKDYRFNPTEKIPEFDSSIFSASEKAVCDSIINNMCCYSGKVLEYFTHTETPWIMARGDLPLYALSDRIIEKAAIGKYFEDVKEKYNMVNPGDIKAYSQEMFNQLF